MTFTWVKPSDELATFASQPAANVPDGQREKVGELLIKAFDYLQKNALTHLSLATAIEEMHSAVAAYDSRQTQDPFGPLQRVVRAIEAQRRIDSSIPRP
jgi:hypothetical protein